jgi:hypothetical protein
MVYAGITCEDAGGCGKKTNLEVLKQRKKTPGLDKYLYFKQMGNLQNLFKV